MRNLRADVKQLQNQIALQNLMDSQRSERDYREINLRQESQVKIFFSKSRR
jgi:hypothetical protein